MSLERHRKQMQLPSATHNLLLRVSKSRGQSMSDTIYSVFKEELGRVNADAATTYVPFPWEVNVTYLEDGPRLYVAHPYVTPMFLDRDEARLLHNELAEPDTDVMDFVTGIGGLQLKVWRGARHVSIGVDQDFVSMTHQVGADIAAVIARCLPDLTPITTH